MNTPMAPKAKALVGQNKLALGTTLDKGTRSATLLASDANNGRNS